MQQRKPNKFDKFGELWKNNDLIIFKNRPRLQLQLSVFFI